MKKKTKPLPGIISALYFVDSGKRILGGFIGLLLILTISGCFDTAPFALPPGTEIRGQLKIPPGPFRIGDRIPVLLTVEMKKGLIYRIPDFSAGDLGGLELKEKHTLKTEQFPGGTREKIQYTLTGWRTGKYSIPALTIVCQTPGRDRINYQLPGSTVEIISVLPKGKTEAELAALDIKPLKRPLGLPPQYRLLGWFLAGIVLIIFIPLGLRRLVSKTTGPDSAITVKEPADIIALRRLADLKNSDYLNRGEFKAYYSELSECLREYMENKYRTKALEMTTEEFLACLAAGNLLSQEYQLMLKQILSTSDLVKFAKQNPPVAEAGEALIRVEQFIAATKEAAGFSDDAGSNRGKTDDFS